MNMCRVKELASSSLSITHFSLFMEWGVPEARDPHKKLKLSAEIGDRIPKKIYHTAFTFTLPLE